MHRMPATGLQLPTVSPPIQEKIHSRWDTIAQIEGEIAMKGFVPMATPEFECPQVTTEILTTANNDLYTKIHTEQLAWFNYASQVTSQVASAYLQYENEMAMIESHMRVAFRQAIQSGERPKMSAEEMQDVINLDPRYSELKLTAQTFKQKKIQLQAFLDGIERSMRVISRQVEIKKIEVAGTITNIPGRTPYQRPAAWTGRGGDE